MSTTITVNGQKVPLPTAIVLQRSMSTFVADAVVEERHTDDLVLTDHPVEQGATITDHAYKLPATVDLTYAWSIGSAQNTGLDFTFLQKLYSAVLALQSARTLFDVYTGKRVYKNMIVKSISTTTDKSTENILILRITCREILIATTTIVTVAPASQQTQPQNTAPVIPGGQVSPLPAPGYTVTGGGL